MRRIVLGLSAVLVLLSAGSAAAKVRWTEWHDTGFQAAIDEAARGRKLVALVVTQPDWCPPCIRLNGSWLENPEDREVSPLLADAVMLEVLGYDPPGAALLERQGVRFQGTPSMLVYRPTVPGTPLGNTELIGSIVGAPSDYPARLRAIVEGHDPVAALRARLRVEREPLEQLRLHHELADLLVSRGDGNGAARALRKIRDTRRGAARLAPEQHAEMDLLVRDAEWKRATSVELRVNRDYATGLAGIDSWIARHGRGARDAKDLAFQRAWALAGLGRFDEAQQEMSAAYLQDGQEGLGTYAYFCFRVGDAGLLADAEKRVRQDLKDQRGGAGPLQGALGRLLRKQGRHAEAVEAFAKAVELTEGDARVVWQGQLDYCRAELEASLEG